MESGSRSFCKKAPADPEQYESKEDPSMPETSIAKHTPGPWHVDPNFPIIVWSEDTMRICDIRGWGHLTGIGALALPEEEASAIQDANARLIAAAPELLEALKHARNQMKRSGFCFEMDDINDCDGYRSIDAAIAKAEGR